MNPDINSNSKIKAYLIITSAFAIGVITGMLCMNLVNAKSTTLSPKKITPLDELSHELQLDQSQKDQIEKVYQDFHQRNKDIFNLIQPQLTESRLQTRAKIRNILKPDQQSRFDELKKKQDDERANKSSMREK